MITIISTDQPSGINVNQFDSLYILEGVTVYDPEFNAIETDVATIAQINIAGNVIGDEWAIILDAGSASNSDFSVSIQDTGFVSQASQELGGIFIRSANINFSNAGEVDLSGTLRLTSENISFYNSGSISMTYGGIVLTGKPAQNAFIRPTPQTHDVVNSGAIVSGRDIPSQDVTEPLAAILTQHETLNVFNTGLISGEAGIDHIGSEGRFFVDNDGTILARGLSLGQTDTYALRALDVAARIENSGTVQGALEFGDRPDRIFNTGEISGNIATDANETGSSGLDRIENTGLLTGNITMGDESDRLINKGTVIGDVSLGPGDDTYRGYSGTMIGTLNGDAGNDIFHVDQPDITIDGGADHDIIYARSDVLDAVNVEEIILQGTGNFTAFGDAATENMNGNSGSNALYGSAAATITLARAGDDLVEGFAGDDTMRGNGGNDELYGGADNDVIFGGTGDDTMTGGAGRDILRGEQGADVFVYVDVLDSAASTDRDVIVGFERGRDEIDVSAINQDAFSFVGTGGFSGTGGMELGYRVVAGGTQVVIEMDENGDGLVDSEIRVRGIGELSADDFVL